MTEVVDHETVYSLLLHERWSELLEILRRHRDVLEAEPLLSHAVDVFVTVFFERLPGTDPATLQPELETLFLMHSGAYYDLGTDRFAAVVERLVTLHADRPLTAVGYARHCPDRPVCRDVLERYDVRESVEHAAAERIRVEATRPRPQVDFTIGLFRSRQEEAFFLAVREVFASYFAYPNVALSSVLDFDLLRPDLSPAERSYFFRGIVDCVVFDQQDGYRPLYFFEIDSPHHDTDRQRMNDGMKDRILAAAGRTLHRLRPTDRWAGRQEFVRLLQDLARP